MYTTHKLAVVAVLFNMLIACSSTAPTQENTEANTDALTESLAEGIEEIKNKELDLCETPLGRLSIVEDKQAVWWADYQRRHPTLGSTEPLIRLIVEQSNCFEIVDNEMTQTDAGEVKPTQDAKAIATDYTLSPSVLFLKNGNVGIGASIGGNFLGGLGQVIGGGVRTNRSQARLTLIESLTGEPVAISVGNAKKYDVKLFGGLFGGNGSVTLGKYSETSEGKLISAAFIETYKQLIDELKQLNDQSD